MKDRISEATAPAERRMQAWALAQEIAERSLRFDQAHEPAKKLDEYITISREAGTGAEEIAELVGQRLGWEVLDKEIITRVAERYHLDPGMLKLVDETEANWAYDLLGAMIDSRIIPHERYIYLVGRIIGAAARRGRVVFVGRGAAFFLQQGHGHGLSVRIVAPEKYRIHQVMQRFQLDASAARAHVEKTDRGRAELVQRIFHRDAADARNYDLVFNVERFGPARVAELIVEAQRRLTARREEELTETARG